MAHRPSHYTPTVSVLTKYSQHAHFVCHSLKVPIPCPQINSPQLEENQNCPRETLAKVNSLHGRKRDSPRRQKFFGTSISFFRSFISFFRTFISVLRGEIPFPRETCNGCRDARLVRPFSNQPGRIQNLTQSRFDTTDAQIVRPYTRYTLDGSATDILSLDTICASLYGLHVSL